MRDPGSMARALFVTRRQRDPGEFIRKKSWLGPPTLPLKHLFYLHR